MAIKKIAVRIPATTSNLGPGFDTLGVALRLYNTVTISRGRDREPVPMAVHTARAFFKQTRIKPFTFSMQVRGDIPMGRGFGSSVIVRYGVVIGLNELCKRPLTPEMIVGLVAELEGHPDNAVPAFFGGFAACAGARFLTVPVSPRLKFVALVPDLVTDTKRSRALLPTRLKFSDGVANLQRVALITAAFCAQNYQALDGLFDDRWHQPGRSRHLPGFYPIIESAREAGALGGFLSGSGSTIMAVTLENPQKIRAAMLQMARRHGLAADAHILTADNRGVKVSVS